MLLKIFPGNVSHFSNSTRLRTAQVSWQENKFSESLGATERQKGFAVGLVPAVESPVATGRAPCFASLTFDGG
jgi:hypothetical protein